DAVDLAHGRAAAAPAAHGELAPGLGQFALQRAAFLDEGGDAVVHLGGRDLEKLRRLAEARLLLVHILPGGVARQRLDAADTGGDRAFAHDLEEADVTRPRHMGAAAKLDGIVAAVQLAEAHDAHLVA